MFCGNALAGLHLVVSWLYISCKDVRQQFNCANRRRNSRADGPRLGTRPMLCLLDFNQLEQCEVHSAARPHAFCDDVEE